jgi:hypothetical protein
MAHFAEISESNIVLRVVVVADEQEHRGQEFMADDLGQGGTWVQTSYWGSIRNKFSAIGDTYDEALDAFVQSPPYPSWVTLNTSVSPFQWEAPVERPDSGHLWDEDTQTWVQPEQPFPSWVWTGGWWLPPIPYPGGGPQTAPFYDWDEATTSWVEVTE